MEFNNLEVLIIYHNGEEFHCDSQEDFETVLQDVSMYVTKDKDNPFSIKEILIKSKFLKEE